MLLANSAGAGADCGTNVALMSVQVARTLMQVWAGLFGWSIMLGFIFAALIQCLTIIGVPTALVLLELAKFALLPFGSHIE